MTTQTNDHTGTIKCDMCKERTPVFHPIKLLIDDLEECDVRFCDSCYLGLESVKSASIPATLMH